MTGVIESWRAILRVWLRYFDVYRKSLFYSLLVTFAEPILYLMAFGYGLGGMIGNVETHGTTQTYQKFIFAGIVGQTVLFQSFFDASYGSFIRMYYQKVFKAIALTPITLSEVLWAELLWDASKATFSASIVLAIGVGSGNFSGWGALACLPLCFMGALLFAGLGLLVSSLAKSLDQLNYPQYLIIFPMFLFGGVYFPIERLPQIVKIAVWILPLTPLISLIRTFTLGLPFQAQAVPILTVWVITLIWMSRVSMMRRLIK